LEGRSPVSYAQALVGVDLSYHSKAGSLKETLTILSPAAQRQFGFSVSATGGASIRAPKPHRLTVVDAEGDFVLGFPAPTIGGRGRSDLSRDRVRCEPQGRRVAAQRHAGPHLAQRPGRVWPVAVDPSVTSTAEVDEPPVDLSGRRDGADLEARGGREVCGGAGAGDVGVVVAGLVATVMWTCSK